MLISAEQKTYALFKTPKNKKLITELTNNSVNFFLFPPLETEKIISGDELIVSSEKIVRFDWIIFTDVCAVDYFLEFMSENKIDFFELDEVRVCAFGEIVADRLRFAQIHVDVIPNKLDAETIFTAICAYAGENNINNLKILLIKNESADFKITQLLIEKRAELLELSIYAAKISEKSEFTKLITLLKSGAIDEFVISAPEDLIALCHFFSNESELAEIFYEVKISAIDVNIFQYLKENNFRPHYFKLQ